MSDADQAVIDLDGRNADRVADSDPQYTSTQEKYLRNEEVFFPSQISRDRLGSGGSQATTARTRPSTGLAQLEVKLPWYKSVTWKDIRDILPTVVILLVGLLIMVLVIPYAFSSVIKQLHQEEEFSRIRAMKQELERNKTLMAAALNLTNS